MDKDQMNIQWYPGHMTKTRRQMEADLKQVDAVCEIVDARIPISSRNPDIDSICGNKPRIMILNRMDLADPNATQLWANHYRAQGKAAVVTDCKSRKGISGFTPAVRHVLREKLEREKALEEAKNAPREPKNPKFYTIEEITYFFGIHRSSIYKWIKEGTIPARKFGNSWRIPREEFEDWMDFRGC